MYHPKPPLINIVIFIQWDQAGIMCFFLLQHMLITFNETYLCINRKSSWSCHGFIHGVIRTVRHIILSDWHPVEWRVHWQRTRLHEGLDFLLHVGNNQSYFWKAKFLRRSADLCIEISAYYWNDIKQYKCSWESNRSWYSADTYSPNETPYERQPGTGHHH